MNYKILGLLAILVLAHPGYCFLGEPQTVEEFKRDLQSFIVSTAEAMDNEFKVYELQMPRGVPPLKSSEAYGTCVKFSFFLSEEDRLAACKTSMDGLMTYLFTLKEWDLAPKIIRERLDNVRDLIALQKEPARKELAQKTLDYLLAKGYYEPDGKSFVFIFKLNDSLRKCPERGSGAKRTACSVRMAFHFFEAESPRIGAQKRMALRQALAETVKNIETYQE